MRTSVLSQFVVDGLLDSDPRLIKRLWRTLLATIRARLSARKDLFVDYSIDGSNLILPISHDLMTYRAANPSYAENISRIARSVFGKYPDLTVIDIGANIGDTVAILRAQVPCPLLCIEGDEYFFRILQENMRRADLKSVVMEQVFLAGFSGKMAVATIQQGGTARLEEGGGRELEVQSLSDVLSRHVGFGKSKLVKVDTDGMDCTILRAELGWLSSVRPVLFFEYVPTFFQQHQYDGRLIFADLAAVGYRQALFYDSSGEFLTSLEISASESVIEDLHHFFSNRRYADVCLIHQDDDDLAKQIRHNELQLASSISQRSATTR